MAMLSRTLLETAKTANNTKKLPKLAAITILHLEIKAVAKRLPNKPEPRITRATPKLAPELMPKTNGPANGFLKSVCINNPDMPKPEPTNIAVMAFGNLNSLIMICQVSLPEVPNMLDTTDFSGILTEPRLMFTKKHTTSTMDSTTK